jgi:hypothetical protein
VRVAFAGTHVSRRCGIATFTADTVAAVRAADPLASCLVVAIDEPGALAAALDTIIDQPGLRHRLEWSTYEYAAHTAWPLVGKRLVAQLRKAAALDRAGPRHVAPVSVAPAAI